MSRRSFIAGVLGSSAISYLTRDAADPALGMPLPETGKSRVLMVSTMTGPVRCDSLGTTLMHEHVLSIILVPAISENTSLNPTFTLLASNSPDKARQQGDIISAPLCGSSQRPGHDPKQCFLNYGAHVPLFDRR